MSVDNLMRLQISLSLYKQVYRQINSDNVVSQQSRYSLWLPNRRRQVKKSRLSALQFVNLLPLNLAKLFFLQKGQRKVTEGKCTAVPESSSFLDSSRTVTAEIMFTFFKIAYIDRNCFIILSNCCLLYFLTECWTHDPVVKRRSENCRYRCK